VKVTVSGAGRSDRQVRDRWLADGTHTRFGVLANAWKETVRDVMGDVRACRDAAKVNVRRAVNRRTSDPAERQRLFTLLRSDRWAEDPYLASLMRQRWRRGANRTRNQVVVRADNYRTFTLAEGGDVWLAIPGLQPRQVVRIPLTTTIAPTGTLRVILRDGGVEIHYQVDGAELTSSRPSGAVWQADHAAAVNVLHRVGDPDITLRTPHKRVKLIMQERTDRHRIRLPIQDSNPAQPNGERIIQPCSNVSNE
jgi:hypothetical protein